VAFDDYKVILYRNSPADGWVAEIPALPSCYALMDTPEQAVAELRLVFEMIAESYQESGRELPVDSTQVVHV
jgi:predicted RNase H-like HicB family nuclease